MPLTVEIGEDGVPFVQVGDHRLRLQLEDLDDVYKERAKNELRENPDNVKEGLERLRDLIKDEPGLIVSLEDDNFLTKFLRPCKYYPNSAFRLIKKFYKFKIKHPKLGLDLTPTKVRHVFDNEVFVFLPNRTHDGSRIMIINAGTKWNPKVVSLNDMLRGIMVAIEIAMLEPKTQVGGVHVILNMQGLSLTHVYQFSPSTAKMISDWVQECTPVRLKGIHVINQSFFFNMAYSIFKPFLGEKLKKRLFFHSANKETLREKIDPESLPDYLGGTGNVEEYPGYLFSEMLYHYEDMFEKFNTYGYSREKASIGD